ncbi:hypothetical protein EDM68_03440 [Candidatus Uhrbacteria bacterium]|nr:MAG: hypothetical protein EDM68_03440 [Candidatus Uhrbacteria bacterium]
MEWDILALALGAWSSAVVVGMALEVQLGWMGKLVALLRRKWQGHGLPASVEAQLVAIYADRERLRIRMENLDALRKRFPRRIEFWRDVYDQLRQMGSSRYILTTLCFSHGDPIHVWFKRHSFDGPSDELGIPDSDAARTELVVAFEAQRKSWELTAREMRIAMDEIEEEILRLESELRLESSADPRDAKREELKRARVRVETLQEELLEEENRNASGPERLKHGIPTDD